MQPEKIGRYEILDRLGQGGFAIVYLARDPRLKREVALKLLSRPSDILDTPASQEGSNKTPRERFEEEAQTLVKLEFDGVVRVYDYGEYQEQPYLVLQYMPGGTLADKLAEGLLTLTAIDNILTRLCDSLDRVHAHGYIHRDLKPQNILFDSSDEAYLADFGIARLADSTKSTALAGTPRYMAPEQFHDDPLGVHTDVYQMGVILFEMLTGAPPYDATTAASVMLKVLNEPAPKVTDYNHTLPEDCNYVIFRAMAKKFTERFTTTGEMAQAFHTAVTNPNTLTPILPSPDPYRAGAYEVKAAETLPLNTPPTPSRIPWFIAGGILVLLLVLLGYLFSQDVFTTDQPPTATAVAKNQPTAQNIAVTVILPTPEPSSTLMPTETPSPSRTPTATETATAVPTASQTRPPTITPTPLLATQVFAQSVLNQNLEIEQIGNGRHKILLIGGLRGDQPQSQQLVQELADYFRSHLNLVPADVTLYFLPSLNQDGLDIGSRYNANNVDLNRNWNTPGWRSDSPQPGGFLPGTGGKSPFSEPETEKLSSWLLTLQSEQNTESIRVITYYHHHSAPDVGRVIPGYLTYGNPAQDSVTLSLALAFAADYLYWPVWLGPYQPTGEAVQWYAMQGFAAADVEIPNAGELDVIPESHDVTILEGAINGILAVIQSATQ